MTWREMVRGSVPARLGMWGIGRCGGGERGEGKGWVSVVERLTVPEGRCSPEVGIGEGMYAGKSRFATVPTRQEIMGDMRSLAGSSREIAAGGRAGGAVVGGGGAMMIVVGVSQM